MSSSRRSSSEDAPLLSGTLPDPDSPESGARVRWTVYTLLFLGLAAAIGTAIRPLIRMRYGAPAGNAARRVATSPAASSQGGASSLSASIKLAPAVVVPQGNEAQVAELLARLRALQRDHQMRHPLWYGRPSPEFLQEMREMISAAPVLPAETAQAATAAAPSPASPLR